MGIYIKGMEMPTKGNPITVLIYPDGTAEWEAQSKAGTAVSVPPHGRLGDLDSLEIKMRNRKYKYGRESDPDCLVVDAPTIIPAEEEET